MKFAAFILAFLILFLSTQCTMAEGNIFFKAATVKKSCCSHREKCKIPINKPPLKDCKGCNNPFMFCSGCIYEINTSMEISFNTYLKELAENEFKKHFFINDFLSAAWHPPEFV